MASEFEEEEEKVEQALLNLGWNREVIYTTQRIPLYSWAKRLPYSREKVEITFSITYDEYERMYGIGTSEESYEEEKPNDSSIVGRTNGGEDDRARDGAGAKGA